MQIDKFTDYALRILMTLAVRAPQRVATCEIATLFDLSENHLSKVATRLVREGFVHSERGRGGGLILAHPPEQIMIGAVVRALMRDDPVVECFRPGSSCLIMSVCGLRDALAEAKEAFFATLDGYTLEDVTRSRCEFTALLGA